jgi:hypothetical protein
MAVDTPTAEDTRVLRRELAREREELARAVDSLRAATSVRGALDGRLPLTIAAAFLVGFIAAGGIGATARLVFRRRREGRVFGAFGPFALVER